MAHVDTDRVDALAYIDTQIDDDDDQRNDALREVDDELDMFPPEKDYLANLTDSRAFMTPLIEYEHSCISNDTKRTPASDLSRLTVTSPPLSNDDVDSWTKYINQIMIKLEYAQRQLVNLSLTKSYNDLAWKQTLALQENISLDLKTELENLGNKTQEVNWKRKKDQERVLKMLQAIKIDGDSLVEENLVLSKEIKRLSQLK